MFQKKNNEALAALKTDELAAHRKGLMVRKAELLQKKKDKLITAEEQTELEELALYLVDVDKLASKSTEKPAAYQPAKGEKDIAVLRLTRGRRFNPTTGEREAKPFVQKFNANEYRHFMANHKQLGYTIEEVLYNPFMK